MSRVSIQTVCADVYVLTRTHLHSRCLVNPKKIKYPTLLQDEGTNIRKALCDYIQGLWGEHPLH